MLKDVFGFAEHQEKATYGLGYELILTRSKDEAVRDEAGGIADARIKIDHIHWYIPHYTASKLQQSFLSKHLVSERPTELRYVERSVVMKELNNQGLWNFEIGSQENMNFPIRIIIGFQQQDRQDCQNLNNDSFCRLPFVSAHCVIGTEKHPDAGILFNYDDDDYSQGYHQFKEASKALTKDNILQPYISEEDFLDLRMPGLMMLVIIYTFSI